MKKRLIDKDTELTFEKWEDGRWFVVLPDYDGPQEYLEMVWCGIPTISWFPAKVPDNRMELLESIGDYLCGHTSYYICSFNNADGELKK